MLVNAAFWASFRREEGKEPRISLAFLPPEDAPGAITMARRLPLRPDVLGHLSPAVERPGIHLGIWCDDDGYFVWGTTRRIPPLCLVVEVVRPGLLVVKHPRLNGGRKFANIAVLEGDSVKVVDEVCLASGECPIFIHGLIGLFASGATGGVADALVRLSLTMHGHGHGGSLLIVPDGSQRWRESIVWPVRYLVEPAFGFNGAFPNGDDDGDAADPIEVIGGSTAVDGATVISNSLQMLAFGAKIGRRRQAPSIERVLYTEPIVGQQRSVVHPTEIGGTRHLSAAQFVQDQQDCMTLVASQDERFTVFSWSDAEQMVQAFRIEVLLL